jgi:hypothetical protein
MQETTMAVKLSDECDDDNSVVELEKWHQAWCQPSTPDVPSNDREEKTSEAHGTTNETAAAPPPQDPLLAARIWIKQHGPALLQDTQRLEGVLKQLLTLSPPSSTAAAAAAASVQQVTGDEHDRAVSSLRHFEWKVVLFLELRVRCGGDSSQTLLRHFCKLQDKLLHKTKKKKSKRKRSSQPAPSTKTTTPEEMYNRYLIEQLTRIAFLLPSNEPFGTFLSQKCLTKYMWNRIPSVVSGLFDYFEVDNPYLPKPEEDDVADRKRRKKPKRSKDESSSKAVQQQQLPAPRRPLLSRRDNNKRKINHFHGMLTDVAKLFDDEPSIVPSNKSSKKAINQKKKPSKATDSSSVVAAQITNTITKPANTVTKPRPTSSGGPVITPHHGSAHSDSTETKTVQSSSTARKDQSESTVAAAKNARVVTASKVAATNTNNNSSSNILSPVRPTRQRPFVAETPLPTHPRAAAETPATNNQHLMMAVGETPSSHHYRRDGVVAETPFQEEHAGGGGSLLFDERIVFSSVSPGEKMAFDEEHQQETAVKPMKLFAALQPFKKSKTTIISKALSVPKLLTEEEQQQQQQGKQQRSANFAVAAARSFLRRKSM